MTLDIVPYASKRCPDIQIKNTALYRKFLTLQSQKLPETLHTEIINLFKRHSKILKPWYFHIFIYLVSFVRKQIGLF